jgi:hypothetical protein
VEAEVAIAVMVAPLLVVPTGTGGGFLLLGGAGAGLRTLWLVDVVGGRLKEPGEGGSLNCCAKTPFSGRLATVTSSTELALSRRLGTVAVATPPKLAALSVLGRLSASADRKMGIRGDVGARRLSTLLLGFRTFCFKPSALEAESYSMTGDVGA